MLEWGKVVVGEMTGFRALRGSPVPGGTLDGGLPRRNGSLRSAWEVVARGGSSRSGDPAMPGLMEAPLDSGLIASAGETE